MKLVSYCDAAIFCMMFLTTCSRCHLTGGRLTDFPTPDFRTAISIAAQEGTQSYREIKHHLKKLPFLVRVHSTARIGDSAGFRFEGVGACQNSGEQGNYGGIIFGYNADSVRIWAPSEYYGNDNGRIIFVGDGWGGEKYTEDAVAADVTVEAWSKGPEPTFQTNLEVDTRRESFYEVGHGLNQLPEIVSVRVSSQYSSNGKEFYFHAVGSAQNPTKVRQYGGVIFSYSEKSIRLWFPSRGKKKGTTGCVVISRGWGGGVNADEVSSSSCRVEIRMWVNLFPTPVFQTDWIGMKANAHNSSFLEISHGLNKLPLYVQVQARVVVEGSDKMKNNFIFEGLGSIQATQFSREKSYGGVVFAYNRNKVRVWVPTSQSTSVGKIVAITGGWGSGKMDMEYDKADIRIRVFADKCDSLTAVVDGQGICTEASEIGLTPQLSHWQKCSNTCGKGKSTRYVTGCHGQSLKTVLHCEFEEDDCGFVSEKSLEYQLLWKRTKGHDGRKKMGDKSVKYEPPYGYPKGSFFMYTATHDSQPGSVGIFLSRAILDGTQCTLRFFYTTGVYFGYFYIEVMTEDRKWHEVWKVIDSQTGNPKAWFGAYVNIHTLVKQKIVLLRFVHEMPEKCGNTCGYNYVAIDNIHLQCQSEERTLIPLATCKKREVPTAGCTMAPTSIVKKGPAFSTIHTKHGIFIKASRNMSNLIAQYQFRVRKEGKYFLWVEGFGQSKQDNGVEVRVSNYPTYFWNLIFRNDTPVWNVFTLGQYLKTGIHTVTLLQYEVGFKFRNLMITPASLTTWSDLGMQSHHISDHMLTSSLYTMTLREEAQFSRLHGLGGWWPRDENAGVLYLQIRLPDLALINKIATQGGYSFDTSFSHYCHIDSFKVKFSLDGENYAYYRSLKTGKEYLFIGNSDFSKVKLHNLSYAVPARGVRFYPWEFPGYPCLRVELYGNYITDGMCEHIQSTELVKKDCFGNRQCGSNAMCQRSEANEPGEEEKCRCISGYHGDKCQHAGCVPNPCQRNGACQLLKGKFKCICPPGYYGRTCLLKCPEGYFGVMCSKSCKCPGYSNCDHVTGACSCKRGYIGKNCSVPCKDGYYGELCKSKCDCGELPVCDHRTGDCYCQLGYFGKECKKECPESFFGKNCTERCQCVNDASCHGHNGQCICKPGWQGERCNLPCPKGKFGNKCHKVCNCPDNADCHHVTGICTCKAGWRGKDCAQLCPLGDFGIGCKQSCGCNWEHTQNCNPVDGTCNCLPGYTGTNCTSKCRSGKYGLGCSETCLCINDATCSHVTGSCQCLIGYVGKYCEKKCKIGYYGEKCKHKCHCFVNQTEECDFKTGECNCRAGFQGDRCHQVCKSGTWGKNCGNKCHCLNNGTCERVNGLCFCASGWEGIMCEKPCIPGYYGSDCTEKCLCKNKAFCDRFNGSCTCNPGFEGEFCQRSCRKGFYGPYCKFECECSKRGTKRCDAATGKCFCRPGWHGRKCRKVCQDGFYGDECRNRCFQCHHVNGPCDKENGNCSCAAGFYGYHCENDCDNQHFGHQCQSKCTCESHLTCNSIDGTCFSAEFATFYLPFYDSYENMNKIVNRRLLQLNIEKFMEKYFTVVLSKRYNNQTAQVPQRRKRETILSSNGLGDIRYRRSISSEIENVSQKAHEVQKVVHTKKRDSFVARIVSFRKVVDSERRYATEVGIIVYRNGTPLNGSVAASVFKGVLVEQVVAILRYSYFVGPVFKPTDDKSGSFQLLWVIAGCTGAVIGLLVVIIAATLYRRRQQNSSPIYKVKRNSKDYEMKPCLPGNGSHVLAFDNPYYDVIAAMGLDDDIEEDYHNPLYPLYDDSSYYGEGHESESGTEMPSDEIYHYPYDRDSGISSGTF